MSSDPEISEIAQTHAGGHASSSQRSSSSFESSITVDYSTRSCLKNLRLFPSNTDSNLVGYRRVVRSNSDTYVEQQQSVPSRAIWNQKKRLIALMSRRYFSSRFLDRSEPSRVVLRKTTNGGVNVQILCANLSDTRRDLGTFVSARHTVKGTRQIQESSAMLRPGGDVEVTLSSEEVMRSCGARFGQGSHLGVNESWCGEERCRGYKSRGRLFISEDDEVSTEDSARKCITPGRDMMYQKRFPDIVSDRVIDARRTYDTSILHLASDPSKVKDLTLPTRPMAAMANQSGVASNRSSSSLVSHRSSRTDNPSCRKTPKRRSPKTNNNRSGEMLLLPPRPGPAPMRPLPSLPVGADQVVSPRLFKAKFPRSIETEERRNHEVELQGRCSSEALVSSSSKPSMPVKDTSRCTAEDLERRRRNREEKVRMKKLKDIQAMREKMMTKTGSDKKMKRDRIPLNAHTGKDRNNAISGPRIKPKDRVTSRCSTKLDTAWAPNSIGQGSLQITEKSVNDSQHPPIRSQEPNTKRSPHLSSSSKIEIEDVLSNRKLSGKAMKSNQLSSSSNYTSTSPIPSTSTSTQPSTAPSLYSSRAPITKRDYSSYKRQHEVDRREKEELQSRVKSLERENAELRRTLMGILQQRQHQIQQGERSLSSSSSSLSMSSPLCSSSESGLALVQSRSSIDSVETTILYPTKQ